MKKLMIFCLMALFAVGLVSAFTQGQCGQTISSGTVVLTEDITGCTGYGAVNINGGTLDCDGYTINGTYGVIMNSGSPATIKNCIINSAWGGIGIDGATTPFTLTNNKVTATNIRALQIQPAFSDVYEGSSATGNCFNGKNYAVAALRGPGQSGVMAWADNYYSDYSGTGPHIINPGQDIDYTPGYFDDCPLFVAGPESDAVPEINSSILSIGALVGIVAVAAVALGKKK